MSHADADSIGYAALLVLFVALTVIGIDWRRLLGGLLTRRERPGRVTYGFGYRIITDGRVEVTSQQLYANGTSQIWIKRRRAA